MVWLCFSVSPMCMKYGHGYTHVLIIVLYSMRSAYVQYSRGVIVYWFADWTKPITTIIVMCGFCVICVVGHWLTTLLVNFSL